MMFFGKENASQPKVGWWCDRVCIGYGVSIYFNVGGPGAGHRLIGLCWSSCFDTVLALYWYCIVLSLWLHYCHVGARPVSCMYIKVSLGSGD